MLNCKSIFARNPPLIVSAFFFFFFGKEVIDTAEDTSQDSSKFVKIKCEQNKDDTRIQAFTDSLTDESCT